MFILFGLGGILFAVLFQRFAPPELQKVIEKHGGMSELYITLAVFVALNWAAAYQVIRGKGRGVAWWAAIFPALFGLQPSLLSPILLLPFAYLLAEITSPRWARGKKPDEQTKRGAASGRGVLHEWLFTIPMVILAGSLFKAVPGVTIPKYVDDGWLVFVAFSWFVIFSHECGHALAGTALKFDLVSFWVCPIEVRRLRKWQIVWNPKLGGHYCGLPRTHENLWRRHVIMVAAGPGINFVIGALCWLVLWRASGAIDGAAFGFLHGVMRWSLITSFINLAPVKLSGFKTDGRYLWEAFFVPAESRRSLALLGCLASRSAAFRPRDWPSEWVSALRSGPDDPAVAALMSLWAQDRLRAAPGDLAALEDLTDSTLALERIANSCPDAAGASAFRFEVAWLRCRYDGITEGAAAMIEPARKDPATDPHEIFRLQGALAAAAGNHEEADSLLGKAEESLLKAPPTGFNLSDLEDVRAFRSSLARAA